MQNVNFDPLDQSVDEVGRCKTYAQSLKIKLFLASDTERPCSQEFIFRFIWEIKHSAITRKLMFVSIMLMEEIIYFNHIIDIRDEPARLNLTVTLFDVLYHSRNKRRNVGNLTQWAYPFLNLTYTFFE